MTEWSLAPTLIYKKKGKFCPPSNNISIIAFRIADLTKAQTLMSAAVENIEKSIKRIDDEIDVLMPRLVSVQKYIFKKITNFENSIYLIFENVYFL